MEQWLNKLFLNAVVLEKVGKTFENCSLKALFKQKQGKHGSHPKFNFFGKQKKRYKLSRTFYFTKIS